MAHCTECNGMIDEREQVCIECDTPVDWEDSQEAQDECYREATAHLYSFGDS